MGGDLLAYTIKKAIVDTTGNVPLTLNLFWLLTFPLTALVAFPTLRALRCSWCDRIVGAVLFSLAPYHFRNGAAHENLAFYVGIPDRSCSYASASSAPTPRCRGSPSCATGRRGGACGGCSSGSC